jgi:glycosyltransferase involved in cell wall biosynthesis
LKIALLIYSLSPGGAERNVVQMADYWLTQGNDVSIITLTGTAVESSYKLPGKIRLHPLGVSGPSASSFHAVTANFRRIRALRRTMKELRPDTVISFMEPTNILSLCATAGTRIRTVIADRNDPVREYYGRSWRILRNITYPFAHKFVVQTQAVLERYPQRLGTRASVIPNPLILRHETSGTAPSRAPRHVICGMGRLVQQKGFDILLEAFAPLAPQFPEWSMEIWGEGPERLALEEQCRRLGLSGRVSFMGHTPAPEQAFARSDIFVLPSRWEGFPNVLLEAMASGRPVIAADCPMGPGEIIRHGTDGLTVATENPEALREALAKLMSSPELRATLGNGARHVVESYSVPRIMRQWDELITA